MNELDRLDAWFRGVAHTTVACSGGIDSLLLAHVGHCSVGRRLQVTHAISPAVPPEATERVRAQASLHGWQVRTVQTGEFDDERYLANPVDRCFHCKSHLYSTLAEIAADCRGTSTVVSGANTDDLGEFRPGLRAAAEHGVRHPYVELGISKAQIRAIARQLGLPYAELPASPCLASRLYTGTRVTAERLRFVHRAEGMVRAATGCQVVRCRIDGDTMRIEVPMAERPRVSAGVIDAVRAAARTDLPELRAVELDAKAYAPGRAFVQVAS